MSIRKLGIEKGTRVCWIGDSLVHHGFVIDEIMRCPENNIMFFNCGVGGATSSKAMLRIGEEIMTFHPDCVFVSFGVNDIMRFYKVDKVTENVLKEREKRFDDYYDSYLDIIKYLKANLITPIMVTPFPYEVSESIQEKCYPEFNDGLKKCSEIINEIAIDKNCMVVDIFYEFMKLKQQYNNFGVCVYNDRVHPNEAGYRAAAKIVLKTLGINTNFLTKDDIKELLKNPLERSRRFNIEEIYRDVQFVKWGMFDCEDGRNIEEPDMVKKLLEMYTSVDTPQWIRRSIKNYLCYRNKLDWVREEYIRITEKSIVS